MTLPDHLRRQVMLASEATVIKGASDTNDSMSIEVAQCQIDGMLNAMVRLRGAREAAEFIFALSDRVVGGLPTMTDFKPLAFSAEPAQVAEQAPSVEQAQPDVSCQAESNSRITAYLWGFVHGSVAALWLRW